MGPPIKTHGEFLKYRSLRQILADKPAAVHAVAPGDTVFTAVDKMAAKDIGFLAVLEQVARKDPAAALGEGYAGARHRRPEK